MGSMMNKTKGNKDAKAGQQVIQYPPQQIPVRYPQPVAPMPPQMSQGYRPTVPMGMNIPQYPGPPPSVANYDNDTMLANLSGLPPSSIARLRYEFNNYTNPFGVIDREGFRRLYIASLLNKTWEEINHEAEMAFRNFDINQTGSLDFNEYISACSRMLRTGGNFAYPMY